MSTSSTAPEPLVSKAVLYAGHGGPEVVLVGERPVRAPGPGEVRIKVVAAAINPTDILMRDIGYGAPQPATPGMDAAGIIEATGEGVTHISVGDEVMAALSPVRPEGGAQQSYIVVPAASVVRKPHGISLAEAATVPMNGLTALYALDHAGLTSGMTFAVTGGAGWLAYQAIVIAKQHGLRVIADAKAEEIDLVRGYGADIVVERGTGFAEAMRREVPDGVDALLDTALLAEKTFPAIKDGGIYIPVRGAIDVPSERGIQVRPVLVYEVLDRTDWLEALRDDVDAGLIVPKVAAEYAVDKIGEAHRFLESGGVRGRPVLVF
ncbi:NADPH:quinone reductase [Rhizobium sp. NFR07]|uniref:NADP-dependent oxidoreductase n=1 Tax=Rhizobium sp. NFR07 TaxID=1566262 RepID=UPI0008E47D42|nr:NADP-dependent oxidoreductase [Rhizobium sp. NFR07]SFB65177.1 NADPH:quinone reductase [Rhizobium sp. NFR07]